MNVRELRARLASIACSDETEVLIGYEGICGTVESVDLVSARIDPDRSRHKMFELSESGNVSVVVLTLDEGQ